MLYELGLAKQQDLRDVLKTKYFNGQVRILEKKLKMTYHQLVQKGKGGVVTDVSSIVQNARSIENQTVQVSAVTQGSYIHPKLITAFFTAMSDELAFVGNEIVTVRI